MIPIIGQPQVPPPQTGINIQAGAHGTDVVIQITSTMVLPPERAMEIAHGIASAAQMAFDARQAIMTPRIAVANGDNHL